MQQHKQNPPKNTRPSTPSKNKNSLPKIFQKATLKKEERKKKPKNTEPHKNTKRKKTRNPSRFLLNKTKTPRTTEPGNQSSY